jgi:hypothetical protein
MCFAVVPNSTYKLENRFPVFQSFAPGVGTPSARALRIGPDSLNTSAERHSRFGTLAVGDLSFPPTSGRPSAYVYWRQAGKKDDIEKDAGRGRIASGGLKLPNAVHLLRACQQVQPKGLRHSPCLAALRSERWEKQLSY